MARAPKKPAPAKRRGDDIPQAERERILPLVRAELRKLGTHRFGTRVYAVLWISQGRPYSEVAKIVGTLLNHAVSKRMIAGWVRTAEQKGIEALHDRRSRAATAAHEAGAQIRKLHARGVSTAGIARQLHLGEIWVRRYLAMRNRQPLP